METPAFVLPITYRVRAFWLHSNQAVFKTGVDITATAREEVILMPK